MDGLLRDKTRPPGETPVPVETIRKVLALTCGVPPAKEGSPAYRRSIGAMLPTRLVGNSVDDLVGLSLRARRIETLDPYA